MNRTRQGHILVPLFLLCYSGSEASEQLEENYNNINISHLMSMYTPVCGTKGLCSLSPSQQQLPHVYSSCPDCSCDEFCIFSRTPCCFQSFFQSTNVHCRDFSLRSSNWSVTQSFNFVVDVCPIDADKKLAHNCSREYSVIERLTDPPVVDPETRISYMNRYCALCHGINRTENWNIEFNCLKQQDFNYISSYEEILSAAEETECSVMYSSQFAAKCGNVNTMVTKCNVSETWKNYDIEIEKACHSEYSNSYQMYKNVFCAMCNPPVSSRDIQLEPCAPILENDMTTACFDQMETMLTYPFKNVFCKYCIQNAVPSHGMLLYYSSRYLHNRSKPFEYKLHITYMMHTILENIKSERNQSDFKFPQPLPDTLNLNITNLISLSKAAFAEKKCNSNVFQSIHRPHDDDSCSCHIGCTTSCCDDLAFKQPLSCISDAFPPRETKNGGYYVLNEFPKTDKALFSLCTTQNADGDITFQIPVTHFYSGKYVSYRNVYCMVGNMLMSKLTISEFDNELMFNTHPWIVISSCPKPVTVDWFNANSFLQYTRDVNCTHSLHPYEESVVCEEKFVDIEKCNETGTWRSFDADVLNACENIEGFRFPILYDNALNISYRNKFCKICNPQFIPHDQTSITECDVNWQVVDSDVSNSCTLLPDVHVCSKFKNSACEICNGNSGCDIKYSKERNAESLIDEEISPVIKSYRSMFALSSFDSIEENPQECSMLEYTLQGTCRSVECFPGKIYDGNACIPLINSASNLRYAIYFNIKVILKQPKLVRELLDSVEIWFFTRIANILQLDVKDIEFENSTFLTLNSCDSSVSSISIFSRVTMHLYLKLTHRYNFEVGLTKFAESISTAKLLGIEAVIHTNLDTQSELINSQDEVEMCKNVKETNDTSGISFRLVLINDLLTCPLVTLKNDEFVVESHDRIRLLPSNVVLSFQHFRISDNGSYQTCIRNTYITLTIHASNIFSPLSILTGSCIMLSLVCLFLTFVTYSLFDNLRTIPGINSMNLIATLFFLQLLILTRKYYFVAVTNLKVLLLVLTHYILLCVFFWLNAISYHMFCVFTERFIGISRGEKWKIVLKYVIYSYVLPLFIVLGNVIFFVINSSGQRFGYGENETLVDDKIAYVVTFILPLSIICLTNFGFFSATVFKIMSNPKVERQDQNRLHFICFVKLFVLTGLTWAFQIVDSFLELSILSYIVAVLNGLQGFFLFLSYVCNARVWRMYKELWVSYISGRLSGFSTDSTKL